MTLCPIFRFLAEHSLAVLLLCLAAGFFLGRVRIRKLPSNATLATLLVAGVVGLVFRQFGLPFSISKQVSSLAFAFFAFSIGFSAGPGFADTVKREGVGAFLRQGALSLCYAALAGVTAFAVTRVFELPSPATMRGLLAGALTQSTILDPTSAGDSTVTVAYGLSYVVGLAAAILFVQLLAPRLLGVTLRAAVKQHVNETGSQGKAVGFMLPARNVQLRAYRVRPGTPLVGGTVGTTEAAATGYFEIASIFRGGSELSEMSQETRIEAGDVLVTVGDRRVLADVPLDRVEELVDDQFLSAELVLADVVLADDGDDGSTSIRDDLTSRGLLLRAALRDGRPLPAARLSDIRAGDVLQVAGLARAVDGFVKAHGYRRDDGAPSDLVLLTLAIGVAALLGAISLGGVSLGTGGCSLLLGLFCGCVNRRYPHVAHVPGAAIALMRSLGLNVFIAVLALGTAAVQVAETGGMETSAAMSAASFYKLALASVVIALIPLLGTLAVGRFILRLPPVPLLGGLCGGATCTPALNALEEETGSSVFTAAYTIPYVVSNVLLTILGSLVVSSLS